MATPTSPKPTKKIADCTAAIEKAPTVEAYRKRAEVYSNAQMKDEALKDLNEALKIEPNNDYILAKRALLHQALNRPNLALADANESVKVKKSPFAYLTRAIIYRALNHNDKAIDDFTRLIKLVPSSRHYAMRSQCYISEGQTDRATDDLAWAFLSMRHFNLCATIVYGLISAFGTYTVVSSGLNLLTTIFVWIVLIPLGILFGIGLLYKFAIDYLTKFHKSLGEHNAAANQLSVAALSFGKATKGIFILKFLYPHILAARATYLQRHGDGKEALALAKERFDLAQNQGDWYVGARAGTHFVALLERSGELSHADAVDAQIIAVLKRAYLEDESEVDGYATALLTKGRILRQLRQFDKSVVIIKEACELKSKKSADWHLVPYLLSLADVQMKLGNLNDADATMAKLRALPAASTKRDYYLTANVDRFAAELEVEKNDLEKAQEFMTEALISLKMVDEREQGNTAGFDGTLGRLYSKQKRYAEAEEHFKKSAATTVKFQSPKHPALLNIMLPYHAMLIEMQRTEEAAAMEIEMNTIRRVNNIS